MVRCPPEEQLNAMEFKLQRMEPLHRPAETGIDDGLSPMNAPDAYAPPSMAPVPVEEMHPVLRQYVAEHVHFLEEVGAFEDTLIGIRKTGYTREFDRRLKHFLNFFDEEFIAHNRREEMTLFPLLRARLLETGEHGTGDDPATAIDLMLDEHTKATQLAAVILNFLGLAFRFPDEKSRLIVLDAALEQGGFLVELLRLHVFREDNLLFALAHRLIDPADFDRLQ